MKIGDAGEAFFVFETDEDIPENIVTSPLLEATEPGSTNTREQPTGRFGARNEEGTSPSQDASASSQEPDFLDLNAEAKDEAPSPFDTPSASNGTLPDAPIKEHIAEEPKQRLSPSSLLGRTAALGKAAIGLAHEAEKAGEDKLKDQTVRDAMKEVREEQRNYVQDSVKAARNFSPSRYFGGIGTEPGDEVLPEVADNVDAPEVLYGHGKL